MYIYIIALSTSVSDDSPQLLLPNGVRVHIKLEGKYFTPGQIDRKEVNNNTNITDEIIKLSPEDAYKTG